MSKSNLSITKTGERYKIDLRQLSDEDRKGLKENTTQFIKNALEQEGHTVNGIHLKDKRGDISSLNEIWVLHEEIPNRSNWFVEPE
jgi:hypothetical protein